MKKLKLRHTEIFAQGHSEFMGWRALANFLSHQSQNDKGTGLGFECHPQRWVVKAWKQNDKPRHPHKHHIRQKLKILFKPCMQDDVKT